MKIISVLGPQGTYCDIACRKFLNNEGEYQIEYYPSIMQVSSSVNNERIAILPFENTLDGFVIESLDQIINRDLHILKQVKLNIDFAFVSNSKKIDDIKNCYVQFKAHGQCLEFIDRNKFNYIITQSNTESLEKFLSSDSSFSAIVPMHLVKENEYNIFIPHIADSMSNETRFFIVSKDKEEIKLEKEKAIEASIVITTKIDRSGILYELLKYFHDLNINLKSIMSRPMKTVMGKYRFYFECSLASNEYLLLKELTNKLEESNNYNIQILGVYNAL